jgi:hypothetical protein
MPWPSHVVKSPGKAGSGRRGRRAVTHAADRPTRSEGRESVLVTEEQELLDVGADFDFPILTGSAAQTRQDQSGLRDRGRANVSAVRTLRASLEVRSDDVARRRRGLQDHQHVLALFLAEALAEQTVGQVVELTADDGLFLRNVGDADAVPLPTDLHRASSRCELFFVADSVALALRSRSAERRHGRHVDGVPVDLRQVVHDG